MAVDPGRADWPGTPWHTKDVPSIWTTVAHHTPDAYATHLAGWRRTSELLSQHTARMRAYRDSLASAWNPSRSPAAAVYLARFDADIDNAQRTHDASVANYTAYAAALAIVTEAQTALRPVAEEYQRNEARQTQHDGLTRGSAPWVEVALQRAEPDLQARQAELTGMARSIMYRASQELIEATAALQIAPPYEKSGSDFTAPDVGLKRPVIPAVVPATVLPTETNEPLLQGHASQSEATSSAVDATLANTPSHSSNSKSIDSPVTNSTNPHSNSHFTISPHLPPQDIHSNQSQHTNPQTTYHRSANDHIGSRINAPHVVQPQASNTAAQTTMPKGSAGLAHNSPIALPPNAARVSPENRDAPIGDPDHLWSASTGVAPILEPDGSTAALIDPGPAIGNMV